VNESLFTLNVPPLQPSSGAFPSSSVFAIVELGVDGTSGTTAATDVAAVGGGGGVAAADALEAAPDSSLLQAAVKATSDRATSPGFDKIDFTVITSNGVSDVRHDEPSPARSAVRLI
jgi:hypothetical protein